MLRIGSPQKTFNFASISFCTILGIAGGLYIYLPIVKEAQQLLDASLTSEKTKDEK
jgi:hypothetical protein